MLIKLAGDIVSHRKTPLALYTEHVLLNHANLKKYYPAAT
jgi:ribose transport system substrate-binding protein